MLTTIYMFEINTSEHVASIEKARILVREFIEINNLGSKDLRNDFGNVYETRQKKDGSGNEAKYIGFIHYNGTFESAKN